MRGFRIDDFSLLIEEKPNQINPKSLPVVIVAHLDAREGRILTGDDFYSVPSYDDTVFQSRRARREDSDVLGLTACNSAAPSFNLDAREGKMGRFRIDDFRFLIEEKPNQIRSAANPDRHYCSTARRARREASDFAESASRLF